MESVDLGHAWDHEGNIARELGGPDSSVLEDDLDCLGVRDLEDPSGNVGNCEAVVHSLILVPDAQG